MDRIARLITLRPWLTIGVVFALTGFAITRIVDLTSRPPILHLEIDPSIDRLIPDELESRVFYNQMRTVFGSDQTIAIAVQSDELFTADFLRRVAALTKRLSKLEGVAKVLSLSTALDIRSSDEDLVIQPFVIDVPETADELADLRQRVTSNPVFAGNLVSADLKTTSLVVTLADISDTDFIRLGLDGQIERAAREEMGSDTTVWLAGSPRLKVATSASLISDLAVIVPLGFVMNGLVAFVFFRRLRGALVSLVCIGLANIWTIATMAVLGYPLNLVSVVVPALVQTVGFAYTIHVLSEYDQEIREHGLDRGAMRLAPAAEALRELLVPLFLTGLTTAVGLFSLTLSPLPAVRETGVISMCGVIYAVIIAATFMPAALSLGAQRPAKVLGLHRSFDELSARLARFDVRHRWSILAGVAVLFVLAGIGTTRIQVNTDFVSNFPKDHPIRVDWEAINHELGGAAVVSVVLRSETKDAFKEPGNLEEIARLQAWLRDQPEVGSTTSLADYVRLIHWGFRNNDPKAMRLPESRALVSQLLFFGGSEDLERFVDRTYRTTRIVARSRALNSAESGVLVDRLEDRLADLPPGLTGRVTGNGVLFAQSVDGIALGQAQSLAVALGFILVVLIALFRSVRIGLLALIPNALPVAFYFGLLGFTGVTLNATTALVACIALGIAVDDSIHYLARFRELHRTGRSAEDAAVEALRLVGRPVTVTTIALCIGFSILMAAELKNQADFGLMTAITLAFAWVTDVIVTPGIAVIAGLGDEKRT